MYHSTTGFGSQLNRAFFPIHFSLNHSLLSHFTTWVLYFPANTNRYVRRLPPAPCSTALQMINNNNKNNKNRRESLRCRHRPRQICVHDFINLMRNELNPCIACRLHTTPHTPNSSVSNKSRLESFAPFVLYLISLCHREASLGVHRRHSCNTISRSLFHPLLNCASAIVVGIACLGTYSSKNIIFSRRMCRRVLFNSPQCLNHIYHEMCSSSYNA